MLAKTIKNSRNNIVLIAIFLLLVLSNSALAHHPLGGKIPSNFFEGFMSGLAHPIIGLDHFAFVIASGLIAAGETLGLIIPLGFILANILGTLIHLQELNLPAPEIIIASSVLAFGLLLSIKKYTNSSSIMYSLVLVLIASLAGIFHGYAYGEAIIGAQMSPLVAYLSGFTIIQLAIAMGTLVIANLFLEKFANKAFALLHFCGLVISGVGLVFLSSALI